MDTIYSSQRGLTADQRTQLRNYQLSQPRPQPMATPASIWDRQADNARLNQQTQAMSDAQAQFQNPEGVQIVHGANIQNDIPTGNEAPVQNNGPQAPADTLPLQQAQVASGGVDVGQDMAPPGWKYEPAPKDPTGGVKEVTPEAVQAGSAAITNGVTNNLPPAQTPVQQATQAADHDKMQGDLQNMLSAKNPKTAWQKVQNEPFYKNSDFYTGLMNVGLAIASGANPMQAYQAGQQAMDKSALSSQMRVNQQALMDQGYSPASIEAAIVSGDASKLKMSQMSDEDRMAAENEQWVNRQKYQSDLNDQNTSAANAEWDRRHAIGQQDTIAQQAAADKRYDQRQADSLARSKALIDYRGDQKKQAASEKANSYDFDPRAINAEGRAGGYSTNRAWIEKEGMFNAASNDLSQTREALQAGDSQKARAGYMQAVLNAVRGEIGDRTIQIEDLSHFAEDPSAPISAVNRAAIKSGFAPTDKALSYLEKGVGLGLKAAQHNSEKLKTDRINSLVKSQSMDAKRATALVNRVAGGQFYDPLNAFDSQMTDSDKQGALSGMSGADLNGF